MIFVFLLAHMFQAQASTKTWNAAAGYWTNAANWAEAAIPADGDDVFITNVSASVILDVASSNLNSLVVSNATLTFTNWATVLSASDVRLKNNGTLTLPPAFTNNQMSNRIYIVCSNIAVDAGGSINADTRGYASNNGPGRGIDEGGGGYGGRGGYGNNGAPGAPYGLTNYPSEPGSGGGAHGGSDGHGGGLVWILASNGAVQIDGTISANGRTSAAGVTPGGSGGGILIVCRTFAGTGVVRADGGNGTTDKKGGGSGGRIAILYEPAAQAAVLTPTAMLSARPGTDPYGTPAEAGTLFFPDTQLLQPHITCSGCIWFEAGVTNWRAPFLVVSNQNPTIPPAFLLTITNDLEIKAGGCLRMQQARGLSVGGDLRLDNGRLDYGFAAGSPEALAIASNLWMTNTAALYLYAGATNGGIWYGGLLDLSGRTLIIPANCAIYPYSDATNGGSLKMIVSNLIVTTNGSINADSRGYATGYGPGAGFSKGGGGHGGYGGDGDGTPGWGGDPYGSTNYPAQCGSAGGFYNSSGYGGGLIWVMATSGVIQLDGICSANGGNGGGYAAGGAGGGILFACRAMTGSGVLRANGGNGSTDNKGGGGGGRIAVALDFSPADLVDLAVGNAIDRMIAYTQEVAFSGSISATNGVNGWGQALEATPGTKRFLRVLAPSQRQLIVAGIPAPHSIPVTNGYGDGWICEAGTRITNTVVSPADESNGMHWVCWGWRLTDTRAGDLIASGITTQAEFTVATNVTLTWLWTNQYRLAIAAGPNGTVNSGEVNGWYTNGITVTGLLATVDDPGTHYFSSWSGEVPAGQESENPLTVLMDRARTNILASFPAKSYATKYWNGMGNWSTPDNWSPAGEPGIWDTAIIQSGTAIMSVAKSIEALVVSNGATLVFTNWVTAVTVANDVIVRSNGLITLPPAYTESQMSNQVYIICANLTVDAGGRISADGRGYAPGNGPGKGSGEGGGGYGGRGTAGNGGAGGSTYGLTNYPCQPGSGSAIYLGGSAGGGLIRLLASNGTVKVDGAITADGDMHSGNVPGGSGGGVLIVCRTFTGNGIVRADGGNGGTGDNKGCGGGGRVAILYDPAYQALVNPAPEVRCTALFGTNPFGYYAELGTVHFAGRELLQPILLFSGKISFGDGSTNWSVASLTASNINITWPSAFALTVTNDVEVKAGGRSTMLNAVGLHIGGDLRIENGQFHYGFDANAPEALAIGGELRLTNSGALYLYAGPTNGTAAHGGLVDLTGNDLLIPTNCAIYPYADPTNGGSIKMLMDNLVVARGGSINGDGKGFATGYGPGAGYSKGGGGYGGYGGDGDGSPGWGGDPCGSSNYPAQCGSAGGAYNAGGYGGGLIWINADNGLVQVDGTLSANGQQGGGYAPGGAGGGILIVCQSFAGAGVVRAKGGNGSTDNKGGGGGGRIAVWIGVSEGARQNYLAGNPGRVICSPEPPTNRYPGAVFYTGVVSVTNGVNGWGQSLEATPGTALFFSWPHIQGSVIYLR